ncbi:phosphoglycerate kinase [Phocicoccus pinnipedialis]|uniref:Phosphoglycerate kinase n=1 Tax=Phocicoccus pinnipedialis TaxID=110845 RepID=A0A6V7RP32_9BACL|nr:phosphoglycerate kinase [Jeotgalicoccus pinnipedialis]MBP1938828.1 phosphoglycerate kinase [Jeotgalicoccus pinnipedialis]CAD2079321.1 Phosphoglycerate kinase [Jeotgalicoccus pinnipedialis]
MKKTVKDVELTGKTVLVRADFNVPMDNGVITNDKRIKAALPTIQYILDQGAKVVLFSHLGRVKEESDKEQLSLFPVAERLSQLIDNDVLFVNETRGVELESAVDDLQVGEVLLVENTRFEDLNGKKESKNDPELGKYWASLGDVFVNDAFGTAHRAHASNVGISENVEAVSGFLMEKEIEFIGNAVDEPKRPFVAILGGAKVSDKITVIERLLEKADKILIGGGMANTFVRALGHDTGKSLVEEDNLELAKSLIEKGKDKLVLPVDLVVAKEFSNDSAFRTVNLDGINADEMALDIGEKTVALFNDILKDAKTVVWNGPMGVFEMENFAEGTVKVCESLAKLEDAITIIGGGDSATAAEALGFADKFSHVSTGGGASLEYLEGKVLPGLNAINDK